MKFAVSSAVPDVVIQPEWCQSFAMAVARLAKWWGILAPTVEYTTQPGQLDDPDGYDVQIVQSLPNAPDDIANHTVVNGKPLCLISWAAVQAEGGSLTGPEGLTVAMSHEILECTIDPLCTKTVPVPNVNGMGDISTPVEVCDWVQGSDYCEIAGIYVANAVGPRFFMQGATGLLDIRSDLGPAAVTAAFQLLPGGYYEKIQGSQVSNVYGERVSAVKRARLDRTGARAGLTRDSRLSQAIPLG